MAICWTCPKCEKRTGGSASNYGDFCDECSGKNEERRKEKARWDALPIEQKVEELKARLDAMQPAIDNAWLHTPIG